MKLKIRTLPADLALVLDDPRLDLFVDVCLTTALRRDEARRLSIEGLLDEAGGVRTIIDVKVKGGRMERVCLPADLRAHMAAFVLEHRDGARSGPLFVGSGGQRMGTSTLQKLWKQAQGRSGIPQHESYRIHDLRHTAITRFYERTKDINLTRMFARHRDISTTGLYIHGNFTDLVKAMEG